MNKIIIAILSISLFVVACNNERSQMRDEIAALEKKVVLDSSSFTFDTKVQQELGVKLLAYAEKFPEDKNAEGYMFKAASLYVGMADSQKSLATLRKYLKAFPNGKNAPQAIFNIGYVYDTQLHDPVKARESYEAFITKYPTHPLAKDTKMMIELLDKHMTDEELVDGFLKKEKADSAAKNNVEVKKGK